MVASGDNVGLAFVLVAAAGLSTCLGAALVVFINKPKPAYLAIALGLAAGVMLYVSLVEILWVGAIGSFQDGGFSTTAAFNLAQLGFFSGMAAILLLNVLVDLIADAPTHVKHIRAWCCKWRGVTAAAAADSNSKTLCHEDPFASSHMLELQHVQRYQSPLSDAGHLDAQTEGPALMGMHTARSWASPALSQPFTEKALQKHESPSQAGNMSTTAVYGRSLSTEGAEPPDDREVDHEGEEGRGDGRQGCANGATGVKKGPFTALKRLLQRQRSGSGMSATLLPSVQPDVAEEGLVQSSDAEQEEKLAQHCSLTHAVVLVHNDDGAALTMSLGTTPGTHDKLESNEDVACSTDVGRDGPADRRTSDHLTLEQLTMQEALLRADDHAEALQRMGLLTALALALHNLPEGITTFVGTMAGGARTGAVLALAIALHNIPEGVVVSMPVYYAAVMMRSKHPKLKAFSWSALAGLSEPLGGLLAFLVLSGDQQHILYGAVFAIVAGMMVTLALKELLPMAHRFGSPSTVWWSTVAGMVVMAASLTLLAL